MSLDSPHVLAMRLAQTLGLIAEAEWFDDEESWAIVPKLQEMMNDGVKLETGVLRAIEDLTTSIRVRGDEGTALEILESHFGASPLPRQDVVAIIKWVRGQLHFRETKKVVDLGAKGTYVPLKNLDYK